MKKNILISVDGEAKKIVEEFGLGIYFEPENKEKFIEKVFYLKNNGKIMVDRDVVYQKFLESYDRRSLANKMLENVISL